MTSTALQESFYVVGGTLKRDAPSYVRREADEQLYDGLMAGRFCYVLTPRQMGKSSLMVRTAVRLRAEGAAVAVLDLTAIGQNLTTEQWYNGLLNLIGQQLDLEDELEDFWDAQRGLGPLQRWMQAVREVVMARYTGRVVIFVDEIDAVRSLAFATDEFFAGIREFYNRRTQDTELNRLTFCLLGVATPTDLIRDTRTTPFNVGQRIELNDFTEREAAPLLDGLERKETVAAALLKRVLYWTGGHPYLTQRLCRAVAEDRNAVDATGVDRLCNELFLSTRARERDDNLLFVRERILRSEADLAGLLDLYRKVLKNQSVSDDRANPLIGVLQLAGITRVVDGRLAVRNRIYHHVFDREWVKANMPDAERRRQRAAYRRGVLRAAFIAALILAMMASLVLIVVQQRRLAIQQRRTADLERIRAEDEQQKAEQERRAAEAETRSAKLREAESLAALQRIQEQKNIADAERHKAEAQTVAANAARQKANAARQKAVELSQQLDKVNQDSTKQFALTKQLLASMDELKKLQEQTNDQAELKIWDLIKDEDSPVLFKKYLAIYPNGKFVQQATNRLGADPSPPPANPTANQSVSGTLAGKVYDPSGAPLTDAQVTIINESSGNRRTTRTDASGEYQFAYLPLGRYSLFIKRDGYEETAFKSFLIRLNQTTDPVPPSITLKKSSGVQNKKN